MSTFFSAVRTFVADEEGVTAIEYGLIAALIAGALIVTIAGLGADLTSVFTSIGQTMKDAL